MDVLFDVLKWIWTPIAWSFIGIGLLGFTYWMCVAAWDVVSLVRWLFNRLGVSPWYAPSVAIWMFVAAVALTGCATHPDYDPSQGTMWEQAELYCTQRSAPDVQACAREHVRYMAKRHNAKVSGRPSTLDKWKEKHGADAAKSAVGLGILWYILKEVQ